MIMKQSITFILIFLTKIAISQPFFRQSNNSIILDNEHIFRQINISNDSLITEKLLLKSGDSNYISQSKGFSFTVNEKEFNGFTGWEFTRSEAISDNTGGNGVQLTLTSIKSGDQIQLTIHYLLYPDLPLIRKWISITNTGTQDIKVENVNVEDLNTRLSHVQSVVHHNYGRMKQIGRFVGNWDDPVVVVHNIRERRGIALGNEAPGVMKRTAYHTTNINAEIGLSHLDDDFPFRKWLKPGESWESTKVFIALYSDRDDGFSIIEDEINEFVIKHMQTKIVALKKKPTFVYNTWNPFRTFINDTLIHEVATAAAECGIQEFIIDDGWQVNIGGSTSDAGWGKNYGDWQVDTIKFPGGLKPTFDYINSLGMKPGLWMSIGAATQDAKVIKDHPEWFIVDKNGRLGDIHQSKENTGFYSSCFGTDWFNYIKQAILRMANEHGLAYAKLDFAVITSAYVNNNLKSGCYATDHSLHRDHHESFGVIYDQVLKLFDELHEEAPKLFIDCTFETAGKLQLMDYAIAQHAEGNWLSNFEEPSPVGPLRVRHMAWWRSPAVPASSLVIGNQMMDDPGFEFSLKSLVGTLPIVLGDPRKLSSNKRKMIKTWSDWMQQMQEKYDYMSYRKDLSGFGEPTDGSWDGWQRINFQTMQGGIFGVFKQGAKENQRVVFLKNLNATENYTIREAPSGMIITTKTGKELMEQGILVEINDHYNGRIFEVGKE